MPPRRRRPRGHIENLPSGRFRAVVYAGIDHTPTDRAASWLLAFTASRHATGASSSRICCAFFTTMAHLRRLKGLHRGTSRIDSYCRPRTERSYPRNLQPGCRVARAAGPDADGWPIAAAPTCRGPFLQLSKWTLPLRPRSRLLCWPHARGRVRVHASRYSTAVGLSTPERRSTFTRRPRTHLGIPRELPIR